MPPRASEASGSKSCRQTKYHPLPTDTTTEASRLTPGAPVRATQRPAKGQRKVTFKVDPNGAKASPRLSNASSSNTSSTRESPRQALLRSQSREAASPSTPPGQRIPASRMTRENSTEPASPPKWRPRDTSRQSPSSQRQQREPCRQQTQTPSIELNPLPRTAPRSSQMTRSQSLDRPENIPELTPIRRVRFDLSNLPLQDRQGRDRGPASTGPTHRSTPPPSRASPASSFSSTARPTRLACTRCTGFLTDLVARPSTTTSTSGTHDVTTTTASGNGTTGGNGNGNGTHPPTTEGDPETETDPEANVFADPWGDFNVATGTLRDKEEGACPYFEEVGVGVMCCCWIGWTLSIPFR